MLVADRLKPVRLARSVMIRAVVRTISATDAVPNPTEMSHCPQVSKGEQRSTENETSATHSDMCVFHESPLNEPVTM